MAKPFKKGHIPWNKGLKGFLSGSKNSKWKGGKPKCEDCNKQLSKYGAKRCNKCDGKVMSGSAHPQWKGGVSVDWEKNQKEKLAGRKRPEHCEICGAMGRICFDHDHKTGKFRGWICHRCNVVLGFVKDNSELLNELAEYLKKKN